jgi:hypothetical protein
MHLANNLVVLNSEYKVEEDNGERKWFGVPLESAEVVEFGIERLSFFVGI